MAGMFKSLFKFRLAGSFQIKSPNCLHLLCLGFTTQSTVKIHELDSFLVNQDRKIHFRNTSNVLQVLGKRKPREVIV